MSSISRPSSVDDPHAPAAASAPRHVLFAIASWVLFSAVFTAFLALSLLHDFRSQPIVGDSANFVFQAVSLAYGGHDLSYDENDLARYADLNWTNRPEGLFIQKYRDGWAFAKPYGYSMWLAPFLRIFGPYPGVAIANSLLLAGFAGVAIVILRLRYSGAVVPLVAGGFTFGSFAVFYAFPTYTDLSLAVTVGVFVYCALVARRRRSFMWAVFAVGSAAFLFAEKPPLVLALLPLLAIAVAAQTDWLRRTTLFLLFPAAFGLAIVPYLYYSDFRSWSAYSGERYYVYDAPPFDKAQEPGQLGRGNDRLSVDYIVTAAPRNLFTLKGSALSAAYYLVGRHTGLLVFFPLAIALVALSVVALHWRNSAALMALVGLFAYMTMYVVLFSANYYGGSASLGNRYFLQVAPLVLGLAASVTIRPSRLVAASIASSLLAVGALWPHYASPGDALLRHDRLSPLQRLLPFETNQKPLLSQ